MTMWSAASLRSWGAGLLLAYWMYFFTNAMLSTSGFFFFFFTSPVRSLTSAFTGVAADDACELSS